MNSPARVQALVAVVLALALGGAWALLGTPLRVRWLVARGAPPAPPERSDDSVEEIRAVGPAARPVLVGVLLDDSPSRARKSWVAAILLRAPFFARAEVEGALGASHPPTARAAAFALLGGLEPEVHGSSDVPLPRRTEHGWDPAPAIPVLAAWVADREDREAGLAARLLGGISPGDPRAKEALLGVIDEVPEVTAPGAPPSLRARKAVVVAALKALAPWCAGDPEVPARVSAMVTMLAKREGENLDWDLQAYAVDLFEISRGRGVDEGLMEVLARHDNPIVRMKVCGALQTFPGTGPARLLEGLAGDEVATVRRSAVRSLANRKDPSLLDLAPYLVEDSLVWVRSETLLSLGHLTGVAPDRCRAMVPFLVSCLETPWPGEGPDPESPAAASWENALTEVIEHCALSLNRITGRCHGFKPEELIDWKRRAEVARRLARDPALRAEAVAEWRDSVPPWPEANRIPPLVRRLEDRDPDNVLRAMRELHRLTGDAGGFPGGVLERGGDDTGARNSIREWRKTPGFNECLRRWRDR